MRLPINYLKKELLKEYVNNKNPLGVLIVFDIFENDNESLNYLSRVEKYRILQIITKLKYWFGDNGFILKKLRKVINFYIKKYSYLIKI